MSRNYGKKIFLFSIAMIICLLIWQLNSPYYLAQFPHFYGVLNSVKNIYIPESYINSYDENNIGKHHEIIKCFNAYYDKKHKKVKLDFEINDINEIDIFSLIVNDVSIYMKNHPNSFLNKSKVDITLWSMGTECIIVSNYIRTYNLNINDNINEMTYNFNNCIMKFPGGDKISSLKNYNWLEVIDFEDIFEVDDINSLDNLVNLKEIKCSDDMFTNEQKEILMNKHKGLIFTKT